MKKHAINRLFNFGIVMSFLLASSSSALASYRSVCFSLKIKDDARTECPSSTTPGARRTCNLAGDVFLPAYGFLVELWDKNTETDDEYIGLAIYHSGECFMFDWDSEEANPDVYIKMRSTVTKTHSDAATRVTLVEDDGTAYPDTSWRDGQPGDPEKYVHWNCKVDEICEIYPDGFMLAEADTSTNYGTGLLALDSAQHAVEVYYDKMDPGTINIEYPSTGGCSNPGAGACTHDRNTIYVEDASAALEAGCPPHELGHVIQMQLFEQDDLRNNCNAWGPGHSPTSVEYQSCATAEGWADYVAAVSWWNPGNVNSRPVLWGFDFEEATPVFSTVCSANAWIEGQVARAFWDADDANNEVGAGITLGDNDNLNVSTLSLATGWDVFPDGRANRQDYELGQNGVNMKDYDFNHNLENETFLRHNCLQSQIDD